MLNTIIYPYIRSKKNSLKRSIGVRGEMLWIGPPPRAIDISDLMIGDVLFCGSAKMDKATKLIQNMTDGSYVHCGIYIGQNVVVDVTKSGARGIKVEKFIESYSYIAVSRSPGVNSLRQRAIVRYAQLCVKKSVKYNWLGAALLPLNEYFYIKSQYSLEFKKRYKKIKASDKIFSKNRMFCSEFVVQCYKACGYVMKQDPYSISHKSSPTWLAEQNIFELVGYICPDGLLNIDKKDPFLGGCDYILHKQ